MTDASSKRFARGLAAKQLVLKVAGAAAEARRASLSTTMYTDP